MQKTINVNYAGIDFEVLVDFKPGRPAPAIDPSNYDNTLCDPGDPGEIEVISVSVDGREIPCDREEFLEATQEQIMEELE